VRTIPDFPSPGVLFRDVLPAFSDPRAFRGLVAELAGRARNLRPDVIVAPEARGFLIGAPLALELGIGLVPIRKAGKLPGPVVAQEYALEYGKSRLEASADIRLRGLSAVVVDDVLATGGTVLAAARLVEELGGHVSGYLFLLELGDLKGRERLSGALVEALWSL
jgi:adenine phosphoribosyltransferase